MSRKIVCLYRNWKDRRDEGYHSSCDISEKSLYPLEDLFCNCKGSKHIFCYLNNTGSSWRLYDPSYYDSLKEMIDAFNDAHDYIYFIVI